jgi:ketosteroid isomerase-like protein
MTSTVVENGRVVEGLYAAVRDGAISAVVALLDPDVVLHEAPSLPFGGVHKGVEAVVAVFGQVGAVFDVGNVAVEQIFADADRVVALIELPIRAATDSGIRSMPIAECFRLRAGKIVEIRPFYWNAAALA